jgi:hypothetical protein
VFRVVCVVAIAKKGWPWQRGRKQEACVCNSFVVGGVGARPKRTKRRVFCEGEGVSDTTDVLLAKTCKEEAFDWVQLFLAGDRGMQNEQECVPSWRIQQTKSPGRNERKYEVPQRGPTK